MKLNMFSCQHSLKAQSTYSVEDYNNKTKKPAIFMIGHGGNNFDVKAWMKGNESSNHIKQNQVTPPCHAQTTNFEVDYNTVRTQPSGGTTRSKESSAHHWICPSRSMINSTGLNSNVSSTTTSKSSIRYSQVEEVQEKTYRNHSPTVAADAEERCLNTTNQRRVVQHESRARTSSNHTTTKSSSLLLSNTTHSFSSQIITTKPTKTATTTLTTKPTTTTETLPTCHGTLNDSLSQLSLEKNMCNKNHLVSSSSSSNPSSTSNKPQPPPTTNTNTTRIWKTAIDPKSGRIYYYDVHSREAQWNKPIELASEVERNAILLKEQQQREFFSTMERNILQSMNRGELIPCVVVSPTRSLGGGCKGEVIHTPPLKKAVMVRTISSMDDELLAQLIKVEKESSLQKTSIHDDDKPLIVSLSCITEGGRTSPTGSSTSYSSYSSAVRIEDEFSDSSCGSSFPDSLIPQDEAHFIRSYCLPVDRLLSSSRSTIHAHELIKPRLRKRNTCGTIYIGSTMAAPDKDALIRV